MPRASADLATFVMPYYADQPRAEEYLRRAVAGLCAQTDPDWQLVIVDDASPRPTDFADLRRMGHAADRIHVLRQDQNRGQGVGRNVGVRWAGESGSAIVLFHDADDLSHPSRLARTRRLFTQRPDVDFVYSTFVVIDENDDEVEVGRLTPSVAEILESHRAAPVEGRNAWIRIGTETGYTTLTSTVSVRTDLALAHPFPAVRGSEDGHAWLRMSAGGSGLAYLRDIPGRYRIPQQVAGSSDRSRIGPAYYRRKADVDTDGFTQALSIALRRNTIGPAQVEILRTRFLRRLAETMRREGQHDLAAEILADASVERLAGLPA